MKNGLMVDEDGTKRYYLNNLWHRVDGPAAEWSDGSKFWYTHGELHRVDGPSVEWLDGSKYWYLHGKRLIHPDEFKTMEEFIEKMNTDEEYSLPWINDINGIIDVIKNPTDKQKRLNALKWKL